MGFAVSGAIIGGVTFLIGKSHNLPQRKAIWLAVVAGIVGGAAMGAVMGLWLATAVLHE